MKFFIVTPYEKKEYEISWLEVNTPVGNFIIQQGHAPVILSLVLNQPFIMGFLDGKQEIISVNNPGILKVGREESLLLISM